MQFANWRNTAEIDGGPFGHDKYFTQIQTESRKHEDFVEYRGYTIFGYEA